MPLYFYMHHKCNIKDGEGPGHCSSVGWALSHKVKGHRFDSRSGHMPGLQVQSLFGAEGSQLMFLSLSFCFPSPLSLKKKT